MTADTADLVEVPLHRIAHGRTGDKGDRLNVSVIARHPSFYPTILAEVTAERVRALFRHRSPGPAVRYELPNLAAVNLVIDDVLQGGVNLALNLDGHGKTLSFLVLSLPVRVPRALLDAPDDAANTTQEETP
ncbi:AtuA-related protein [Azospirillum sp. ST 5-10]|uniref:AtuA-related protein n=1 Tax=unclassified Azospirillum TaxID=2630922 RepID=UPI003F4A57F6